MNISAVKDKCTGCSLCALICPRKCVKMQPNEEGFYYPQVNENICVDCGLCFTNCPTEKIEEQHKNIKCYAAQSRDNKIYKLSASGGIATEIAKQTIIDGGVVYGCMLTKEFNTIHVRVSEIDQICKIQSSKYSQSSIINVLPEIKKDTQSGRFITFIGTPCQVAAARRYCGGKANILYIDLICHGVTNDCIFQSYIRYLEKSMKLKVLTYNYRDKCASKDARCESFIAYKGNKKIKIVRKIIDSPFYYGYLKNDISRLSCYNCMYQGLKHMGDITLGDFWGVDKLIEGADNDLGYSKVLINTEKGLKYYGKLAGVHSYDVISEESERITHEISTKRAKFFSSKNVNGEYDWNILKPNLYFLRKIYTYIPFSIRKIIYRLVHK